MSLYPTTFDHDLYPGDLIALEFLAAAEAAEGNTTYGDATAQGDFYDRTDATLSAMKTRAQTFFTGGVADAGSLTVTKGFSSATPREYFDCFISDSGGGTGTWQYATASTITSQNYALALRGWHELSGYDATVSDVWSWLVAATSNASYETGATASRKQIAEGSTGVYRPHLCLTTSIEVLSGGSAVNRNASSLYNWATVGLLAAIASSHDPVNFRSGKRALSKLRFRYQQGTPDDLATDWPALRGKTGLGYQTFFTESVEGGNRRVDDVVAAAQAAMAYRYVPRIFVWRDHL